MRQLLLTVVLSATAALAGPLPRPAEGEWFSLTLNGTKLGYAFNRLSPGTWEGQPAQVSVNEFFLRAKGTESFLRVEKAYEPRVRGRLLGFRIDQREGTTSRTWLGTCAPEGVSVVHRRPHAPDEVKRLPPTAETIEASDLARLAASRRAAARAVELNDHLEESSIEYAFTGEATRQTSAGPVQVLTVRDPVSATTWAFAPNGRVVDASFGPISAEPTTEAEAKKQSGPGLDLLKAGTVTLARPLRSSATLSAERLTFLLSGVKAADVLAVPARQKRETLSDGRVRVEVVSREPTLTENLEPAWAKREELRAALQATPQLDARQPELVAFAKKAVGDERDAWKAAQKLATAIDRAITFESGNPTGTASEVLARGKASRPELVRLFIACARAVGLPAREVTGILALDGTFFLGNWAEIFVGEWLSFDPLEAGPASATHLAVRDMTAVLGQGVTLEVLEGK